MKKFNKPDAFAPNNKDLGVTTLNTQRRANIASAMARISQYAALRMHKLPHLLEKYPEGSTDRQAVLKEMFAAAGFFNSPYYVAKAQQAEALVSQYSDAELRKLEELLGGPGGIFVTERLPDFTRVDFSAVPFGALLGNQSVQAIINRKTGIGGKILTLLAGGIAAASGTAYAGDIALPPVQLNTAGYGGAISFAAQSIGNGGSDLSPYHVGTLGWQGENLGIEFQHGREIRGGNGELNGLKFSYGDLHVALGEMISSLSEDSELYQELLAAGLNKDDLRSILRTQGLELGYDNGKYVLNLQGAKSATDSDSFVKAEAAITKFLAAFQWELSQDIDLSGSINAQNQRTTDLNESGQYNEASSYSGSLAALIRNCVSDLVCRVNVGAQNGNEHTVRDANTGTPELTPVDGLKGDFTVGQIGDNRSWQLRFSGKRNSDKAVSGMHGGLQWGSWFVSGSREWLKGAVDNTIKLGLNIFFGEGSGNSNPMPLGLSANPTPDPLLATMGETASIVHLQAKASENQENVTTVTASSVPALTVGGGEQNATLTLDKPPNLSNISAASSSEGNLAVGTLSLTDNVLTIPISSPEGATVGTYEVTVNLNEYYYSFDVTVEAAEAGVPTLVSAEGQGITAGTAVASNAETTINGATFTLENLPEGTTGNDITLVSSDGIVISGDNFMLSEDLSTATVDIFVPALAEGEYTVTLRVFLGDGAYQDTGTFTITTAENAEVLPTATYTGPTTATANEAFTATYDVSGVADGKTHEDFRIIANGDTANPISGALSATSFSASVTLSTNGTVELQYLNSAGSWVTIGSSTSIAVETAEVDPTMSDASAGDLTGGTSGSSSASATIYAPDGTTADNFTFGAVAGLIYSNIAFANGTLTFTATNADDLMPGSYSIPVYLNNELLGSITITVETPPDPTVAAGTSVEVQSGETTTVSATLEGVTPVHNATVTVGGVAATLNADGTLTWNESVALQAGTPTDETRTVTYNGVEIGTIAVNAGEAAVTQSNVIDLGTAASFATDLSVPASGGEISGALANVPGLATATDISVSYTLPGGVSVTTSVSNLTLNDDGSGTIYINIGEIDNAETGDEIQVSVSIGGVEIGETTANVVVEAGF